MVIAVVLTSWTGPAFAQENSGVSLGVKMWVNDWTHDGCNRWTLLHALPMLGIFNNNVPNILS